MKLRDIPKIDKIIKEPIFSGCNQKLLTKIAKDEVQIFRERLLQGSSVETVELLENIKKRYEDIFKPSLVPLINATGVILHTNMGRSLIDKQILNRASKVICNYSNLEYDLQNGCRGERYEHVSSHLKNLLGVEDVLVVNNNASAVFLVLNTFAKDKEVIVSRGELVEIGGSFRIPEVMSQSGAILKEVGATNKTKLSDYKNALSENSAMLMKVHQSNFTIEGFSETTPYKEIKELSEQNNLLDYYDLGSGYIPKLPYNLGQKEPTLIEILKTNPSLISFSGDKLFGSVQAGIISGKKQLIDKLKRNQLLRMLRVDKITLSILEESIKAYLKEEYELIPTLDMLFKDISELEKMALHVEKKVGLSLLKTMKSTTVMGGGTLPNREFPTVALSIDGKADKLEIAFRKNGVIGRIENDKFLLDFRSIRENDLEKLITAIQEVLK